MSMCIQINTFITVYPSISTGKIFQKTLVILCTRKLYIQYKKVKPRSKKN